ncbi:MAG: exodeoxyribonuclease III [bacterium]|nr:exodeoxyribonuclease III [bacterium]
MDIVTWNVNSVRARLPRLLELLKIRKPDVVCLQETKVVDGLFPRELIEELGYNIELFGQKTYNGVAILSRSAIEEVTRGFPDDTEEDQKRVIGAIIEGVMILNLYVVNGKAVGDAKYDFKLQWLEKLLQMLTDSYPMTEKVVVTGDFNITFDDRDVYDPDAWRDKILCSLPERKALAKIVKLGLTDAFRHFHGEDESYTWWDFRTRGYQRGNGLRIDHFLVSKPALEASEDVWIDTDFREGEKPSDHAPVFLRVC